jgi:hypothetical protein
LETALAAEAWFCSLTGVGVRGRGRLPFPRMFLMFVRFPSEPGIIIFAGLRVRDFNAARQSYERLLGEATFFPHAKEAVWTLAEDRSDYVVEHADGAGKSGATSFVDDLDAHMAAIAATGLEPDEIETYPNGVRKAIYRDANGNKLGFAARRYTPGSST